MAARRNRRGRRNRGRFGALYKLLSIVLILAAIVLGCIVFFRVDTVEVTGDSPYTAEEIIAVSGVEQGDNLFGLNKYQISSRIYTQLPYIDTVTFVRHYPDTLVIRVTAGVPAGWFESGGQCWLVDSRGKILESGGESLAEGRARILGLDPVNPTVGSPVTVPPEQQEKLERLLDFLAAIQARQMTGSLRSFLDLTAEHELRFGYGDNLTVLFPMNGDFRDNTYYLQQTLWTMDEEGIPRNGTLDLTYGNLEARLLPERWLPDGVDAPAPEPEETTDAVPVQPSQKPGPESAAPQGERDENEDTSAE